MKYGVQVTPTANRYADIRNSVKLVNANASLRDADSLTSYRYVYTVYIEIVVYL